MFPCPSSNCPVGSSEIDGKFPSYGPVLHSVLFHLFHFQNIIGTKFHFEDSFLFRAVTHVVNLGSKEKVTWITAASVVAFMAHVHSIWDGAVYFFKHSPVCKAVFLGVCKPNDTPGSFNFCTSPWPALIFPKLCYFAPKPFTKSFPVIFLCYQRCQPSGFTVELMHGLNLTQICFQIK